LRSARPDAARASAGGRAEARMVKQCRDFIRPFLRMARHRTLPKDIASLAGEIVDHCRAR